MDTAATTHPSTLLKPPDPARHLPVIPASFFGIVLGVMGLGFAWRQAHRVWAMPALVGELLLAAGAAIWLVLAVCYAGKWIAARSLAIEETRHPVQCCFVGLIGVATLLVAGAALPYARLLAFLLFVCGAAWTLAFAVWRTGLLWRGERDPGSTTAVLYLPAVAGFFVTTTVAASLGFADWAQLAFGAGLFSWLAIESVLLHRLYTAPSLPPALRPTLGIQLAPPCVGAVAYLSITQGAPDLVARALLGYALLQALLLGRGLPWIAEAGFAPSFWAFSFGSTALATAPLLMIGRGERGAIALLAPWIFVSANLAIVVLGIGTAMLLVRGRLLLPSMPRPA